MPGHRGRDDVERARRREALGDARIPWVSRYSTSACVGREEAGADPRVELGLVVAERGHVEHRGQPRFALDLDDRAR